MGPLLMCCAQGRNAAPVQCTLHDTPPQTAASSIKVRRNTRGTLWLRRSLCWNHERLKSLLITSSQSLRQTHVHYSSARKLFCRYRSFGARTRLGVHLRRCKLASERNALWKQLTLDSFLLVSSTYPPASIRKTLTGRSRSLDGTEIQNGIPT